jgi:ribA/ribD-fused uncharacterized protein
MDNKTNDAPILFYGCKNPFGEFSNMFLATITMDGKKWPSVEHYFQAMKFIDNKEYMEKIRTTDSPYTAKKLGGSRSLKLRGDWESVKDMIMLKALQAKFSEHPKLARVLLGTRNSPLVENSPSDYYWGCGAKGNGNRNNMLGKLLCQVRSNLQTIIM